ncbi:MAG: signal recognition particle protein [Vicinamibacteria bacterium]|jgi:signal recognition particle subunit SRP54|nr:signal recognition particle protein [Vicinamibacteria bacterium]
MFDSLSDRLQGVFKALRGRGSLTEADIDAAMKDIRLALLEADVNLQVTKDFLDRVRAKAVGQEVLRSLSPGQAVVRIVRDEMIALLGASSPRLKESKRTPTVIMMVGLQGSGKTTTTSKLAKYLSKNGRYPLVVSTDVARPAAREQLGILAGKIGVKFMQPPTDAPLEIVKKAIAECRSMGYDILLIDTAGRLHIDEDLMAELKAQKALAEPSEIFFVADAMTGQDALTSASAFQSQIGITGIVLTKLDGDARGGSALSAASVTGCPIRFAGTGEKPEDFELFDASRMAGRILGMGDVMGLIERVEESIDPKKAAELAGKMAKNEFSLADYRDQLKQVRKMGKIGDLVRMIPGVPKVKEEDMAHGEGEMKKFVAILDSMTNQERERPEIISGPRRKRMAMGSGTKVEDVNRLLKQYEQTRKMMKMMSAQNAKGSKLRKLASRFGMPGLS